MTGKTIWIIGLAFAVFGMAVLVYMTEKHEQSLPADIQAFHQQLEKKLKTAPRGTLVRYESGRVMAIVAVGNSICYTTFNGPTEQIGARPLSRLVAEVVTPAERDRWPLLARLYFGIEKWPDPSTKK